MFGKKNNKKNNNQRIDPVPTGGLCSLTEVPEGEVLKIVEIRGSQGLHRRLLALGFHPGDLVTLENEALMNGPVLVKNLTMGSRVALGRGIAQKIMVEVATGDE